MNDRVLTEAEIRAMLGPMHSDYIDAVRRNEARMADLEKQLAIARGSANAAWVEVDRLTAALHSANNIIDRLAVLAMRYRPTENEGSEP